MAMKLRKKTEKQRTVNLRFFLSQASLVLASVIPYVLSSNEMLAHTKLTHMAFMLSSASAFGNPRTFTMAVSSSHLTKIKNTYLKI